MAEIKLVRIDDRLLHGQVSKSWVDTDEINLIVVANDDVVEDEKLKNLMNISTPLFTETVFLTVSETIASIKTSHEGKNALILVENPKDAYKLAKANLGIKSINVGNMRNLPDKEKVCDDIFVGKDDRKYFNEIHNLGIDLDVRILKNTPPKEENKLF